MRAYWAVGSGCGNFGDILTPLILRRVAGIELVWSEREDAELFGIGSIAELIPQDFTGVVIGTGCMFAEPVYFPDARVLALRGVLTASAAGIRPPLLADLGLLAPELLRRRYVARRTPLGTVRCGGDYRPPMGVLLDPTDGDPERLVETAARCQRIVSSSLHGVVLADALGIENMWDPHPESPPLKFRDYASAYGETIAPYRWRLADQEQVARKQAALRSAVRGIAA